MFVPVQLREEKKCKRPAKCELPTIGGGETQMVYVYGTSYSSYLLLNDRDNSCNIGEKKETTESGRNVKVLHAIGKGADFKEFLT